MNISCIIKRGTTSKPQVQVKKENRINILKVSKILSPFLKKKIKTILAK